MLASQVMEGTSQGGGALLQADILGIKMHEIVMQVSDAWDTIKYWFQLKPCKGGAC